MHSFAPSTSRTGAAAELHYGNAGLPQLEASVGRWQLAPRNGDPFPDQRPGGVTTAGFLCLSQSPAAKSGAPSSPGKMLAVDAEYLTSMLMRRPFTSGQETRLSVVLPMYTHMHVGGLPI